jgi:hypothetical protein
VGSQQILQRLQEVAVLEPAEDHRRGVGAVLQGIEAGSRRRPRSRVPGRDQPGRPGAFDQGPHQVRHVLDRPFQAAHHHQAGMPGLGEGDGLQGGRDLPGPGGAFPSPGAFPAAQEPEGGQPSRQGPGHGRPRGVEVRLQPGDQLGQQPLQQRTAPLLRTDLQVRDPEPFRLGHGRGPVAQPVMAQALLPQQDQDPLHGRGRAQAQHQGLQVGQLSAPAPQERPGTPGQVRRTVPGALPAAGAGRWSRPVQGGEQGVGAALRPAQDPRRQHPARLDPDHIRRQYPGRPGPAQGFGNQGPQLPAPVPAGRVPQARERDPGQFLEKPRLGRVEAQAAGAWIHGFGPGEALQEFLLEGVEALAGRRLPQLQQPARPLSVPAHHGPGAARLRAALLRHGQLRDAGIPVGAQPPAVFHQGLTGEVVSRLRLDTTWGSRGGT